MIFESCDALLPQRHNFVGVTQQCQSLAIDGRKYLITPTIREFHAEVSAVWEQLTAMRNPVVRKYRPAYLQGAQRNSDALLRTGSGIGKNVVRALIAKYALRACDH